ncbi:MAG: tRNA pseudouridine(13) synthase TruD [Halobacteriales archaeon]
MRPGHVRERPVGMRYYRSDAPGVGGRLKADPADFRVEERPGVELEALEADPGAYPYLVVEATLEDWDTHRFVDRLARAMGIHPGRVGWAGTKDANAVTTQWLSVRGVESSSLPTIEGAELAPVGRLGRQLEFGDHAGNAFAITVRGARDEGRAGRVTADLAGDDGRPVVPNFFGMQRFGTRRPITHRVGRAILRGRHCEAVRRYLGSSTAHEPDRTRRFRAAVEESGLREDRLEDLLERCPGYLGHERRLLEALAGAGAVEDDTCRSALESLGWSLARLFVHAVQSHAFNEILSERLRRDLPLDRPVEGDVICMRADGGLRTDRPQRVDGRRLQAARRHCERGRAAVTAPLVGPDTGFAGGEPGRIERAVVAGLGLEPAAFQTSGPFRAGGDRRALAIHPEVTVAGDPPTFRFELPPGAYATVVMREYCKVDPLDMA